MNRVNEYVIKQIKDDVEKFRLACDKSSSSNALIRKEILGGRI